MILCLLLEEEKNDCQGFKNIKQRNIFNTLETDENRELQNKDKNCE